MTPVFRIELLPAREGDCIWVSYGDEARLRHVLIDGGRAATYADLKERFAELPCVEREIELLLITHVDRDHIEGVLSVADAPDLPVSFKDVWFNGYHHLKNADFETFGPRQGELLSSAIAARRWNWNAAFNGRAVLAKDDESPTVLWLDGDMKLTILSPNRKKLDALLPRWEEECEKAGIIPGRSAEPDAPEGFEVFGRFDIDQLAQEDFQPDKSEPNGSSIAILGEFQGNRVLFGADAHVDRLIEAIAPLASKEGGRLKLDALKVPHHGSRHNISKELLDLVECQRYLFSTNGNYFDHPDPVAVARIIKFGGPAELIFNYAVPTTTRWTSSKWYKEYSYTATFPSPKHDGSIVVEI